ncbi:hypothetical protein SS50377_28009 [Spironucleus salmonicida]|uniref:Uncharacterized protein n=1 Tax=Spironucleus salmonicida TaxID=348837 RepID=V6LFT7_9EUKA|nr:hypothetical protein SS50377_28009 [Spironucleus salmonicida]|eukprot:EST42566.1 Hypothetical protein SS50377_17882 [Spironucleus salmonicida]
MYNKINQSPKASLTPLAARAESSDTSFIILPDFGMPKPLQRPPPRQKQSSREIMRRLNKFQFNTYESLKTDKFSIFPRFPGNTNAEIAKILKNPRAILQLQKSKSHVIITNSLDIPPASPPKVNITGFLKVGEGILRQDGTELIKDEFPSNMSCRDANLMWNGFQIKKPVDHFVSVAIEFCRASNYVYQQRNNDNLDVLKISKFVVQKLSGEIEDNEIKDLLDLVVVALTGLQMAQ